MELATEEYAARVVNMLVRSFPTQPSDPRTYASQLTTLCTGRPHAVLKALVDPNTGLVAKAKFLPTVAEVREWLETQPYGGPMRITHRKEPEPEPQMTAEERDRADAMWAETKPLLQAAALKMRGLSGKPLDWSKTQADDPEARMRGLRNLEALRGSPPPKNEEDAA